MKSVEVILEEMILDHQDLVKDIEHFLKVYAYASMIGKREGLDDQTQRILEIAAIVHDIACPSLKKEIGKCPGYLQEERGPAIARSFLEGAVNCDEMNRICYLVGHHHSYEQVDGLDYQILLEADYLINASESSYDKTHIEKMYHSLFKTETGRHLLKSMYLR